LKIEGFGQNLALSTEEEGSTLQAFSRNDQEVKGEGQIFIDGSARGNDDAAVCSVGFGVSSLSITVSEGIFISIKLHFKQN